MTYANDLRDHYELVRARLMRPGVEPVLRPRPRTIRCGTPRAITLPYIIPKKERDVIDVRERPDPACPLWRRITDEVLAKHGLAYAVAFGHQRSPALVVCRQEVFYRLAHETSLSLPAIGRRFGRDHTTVLWGIRRHAAKLAQAAP